MGGMVDRFQRCLTLGGRDANDAGPFFPGFSHARVCDVAAKCQFEQHPDFFHQPPPAGPTMFPNEPPNPNPTGNCSDGVEMLQK